VSNSIPYKTAVLKNLKDRYNNFTLDKIAAEMKKVRTKKDTNCIDTYMGYVFLSPTLSQKEQGTSVSYYTKERVF
jgi:hypothetical protein